MNYHCQKDVSFNRVQRFMKHVLRYRSPQPVCYTALLVGKSFISVNMTLLALLKLLMKVEHYFPCCSMLYRVQQTDVGCEPHSPMLLLVTILKQLCLWFTKFYEDLVQDNAYTCVWGYEVVAIPATIFEMSERRMKYSLNEIWMLYMSREVSVIKCQIVENSKRHSFALDYTGKTKMDCSVDRKYYKLINKMRGVGDRLNSSPIETVLNGIVRKQWRARQRWREKFLRHGAENYWLMITIWSNLGLFQNTFTLTVFRNCVFDNIKSELRISSYIILCYWWNNRYRLKAYYGSNLLSFWTRKADPSWGVWL